MNIMLIASSGGHLSELKKIYLYKEEKNIVITEKTNKKINRNNVEYLVYGSRKNKIKYPFIFLYNFFLSFKYLKKYKPNLIISTGAHSCVTFFWLAKFFKIKTIYIESFARVNTPSLTYKLIKNQIDVLIVQHKSMLEVYPNAIYLGSVY